MRKEGFRNKCVVITGGASGIGLAVGRRFGRAGARVVLLDQDAWPVIYLRKRPAPLPFKPSSTDMGGLTCW